MKIVMFYDQIQSGLGAKDDRDLPLGILKEPVGPAVMMEGPLHQVDGRVVATLCCGWGTYEADPDEVARKLVAMCHKINPDVVMCGPAFDYAEYAEMAGRVAADLEAAGKVHALAAMSEENKETIARYRDKVTIVRTPKKGGMGLNQALKNMCLVAQGLTCGNDISSLRREACF
ncbi:GrdB-related putative oxidoreductase [Olsenella sp. Marseille-P4559]|uniref:GrdB-related putative oxidoreductase n=1 Tax=Olsenella sp. Marseille-P4559 TaxID=2364795 RepID=UPI00102F2E19|nr:GrdB-related putative oxidoreductase [Olsenella sp. Marseille-P4559]